jgi:hypothetical protein
MVIATHDPYGLQLLPTEMWTADRIHPYAKNNKIHSSADVEATIKSIREYGLFNPIIVDIDGIIIAGHKRFQCLLKMGHVEFPVKWAKHLSKNQADAARIADNKTQGTEYDSGFLAEELERLANADDVDLASLGLDDHELGFLTEDLGAMNMGGLAGDLDAEIDAQDAETAGKVAAVDDAMTPISKVFGFKAVPVRMEPLFKRFIAKIEDQTGKTGLDAFEGWLNAHA